MCMWVKLRLGQKKTNFMASFYGWGSTASRLMLLRGGKLLFITKFPDIGTHSLVLILSTSEGLKG